MSRMNLETTDFYHKLAGIYDEIFPVELSTMQFLRSAGARPGQPVLDLACGSGLYTEALLKGGVDVYGLDGSPDLIEQARARSSHPERFVLADMGDIGVEAAGLSAGGKLPSEFGFVFCIGNSLSHLASSTEVQSVLRSISRILSGPEARVVIQFVEMEEIPVGSLRDLPTLEIGAVRFERRYTRSGSDQITFDAALVDGQTGDRQTISNHLLQPFSLLVNNLNLLSIRTTRYCFFHKLTR